MKNFKRAIAMLMALTMLAACAVSCKKDENADGLYSKKLELTVWETQGTDYTPTAVYDNDIVAKWLEEKTNVTIENMYGNDGGQWDSKLSKLVAGGNLPDIIHCGAFQGPAHFSKIEQLGELWEMTPELLKEYAPNVWERTPQEFWDAMTVDGKILGIPYASTWDQAMNMNEEEIEFFRNTRAVVADVTYSSTNCLWVRDDILKKFFPEAKTYDELWAIVEETGEPVGEEMLDIPIDSTEEFIKFMYDIKDLNLKEDGKSVYTYGYNGGDNWGPLTWLGSDMYGYKGHAYSSTWNSETQRIEIPLTRDIIKNAAKTQSQMIRDGVIEQESLAHTATNFTEKVMNGQYAIVPLSMVSGGAQAVNDALDAAGKSYNYRPFITQVPAQKGYGPYEEGTLWSEALCLTKTLSEDEMHQVLNWINVQFSDEYEQVRNWGPEEAGLYVETEDGKRKFKDEKLNKFFIEGDKTALASDEEKMGLGGKGGLMQVTASHCSKWTPDIMYRVNNNTKLPLYGYGFKFTTESKHAQNIATYPPCQIWAAQYAGIQEVVDFWAERGTWENKITLAIAADDDAEFEERWKDMLNTVNDICDVKVMEDKMTEIAKTMLP